MRLLALLAVRNEIRYIESVLAHVLQQGAEVCVIDNGSTDGTREVAERWLGHGVVRIDDQPWTGQFELATQLRMKERLAAEEVADWYLHLDADERRYAPPPYGTLVEGLADADVRGWNAVDFEEFVFVPTAEDPSFEDTDFATAMRWYYYFEPATPDRLRINAWRRQDRVDLVSTAGHHVRFPEQRVFPRPFVMRHYPVLSAAHAEEKYGGRTFAPDELANSWHGDRARFRPEQVRLPRRDELHEVGPGEAPDTADPWDRHPFLDPGAAPRDVTQPDDSGRPARLRALVDYARRHSAHVPQIPAVASDEVRPRWSVVLPVRDPRADHLTEALRSVIDQDPGVEHMEIVVVDDASTTDVAAVVSSVGGNRVAYHRNPEPLGLAGNWNEAVNRSRGELVHLLHQDDRVLPGFYDRVGRPLLADRSLVAGFCRVACVDDGDRLSWTMAPERIDAGVLDDLSGREAEQHRMLIPGVVVRRSTYEDIAGYRDDLSYCTDWDFLKRVTVLGPVWYEPLVLAHWRRHDDQESARLQRIGADLADRRRSIELTALLLPSEVRERSLARAHTYSVVLALERLRDLVEADALDDAAVQAREVLAAIEARREGSEGRSDGVGPVSGVVHDNGHDGNEDDRHRIAELEAQVKGWVSAVRVAQARTQARGAE